MKTFLKKLLQDSAGNPSSRRVIAFILLIIMVIMLVMDFKDGTLDQQRIHEVLGVLLTAALGSIGMDSLRKPPADGGSDK